MKQSGTKKNELNKNATAFINSIMDLAKEMQNGIKNLSPEEAKAANIDMKEMEKEAKKKIDELHSSMKRFETKIKSL